MRVIIYGLRLCAKYTDSIHKVTTDMVWFAHPKYCQMVLNPSGFSICHINNNIVNRKMGTLTYRRLRTGF